MMKEACCSPMIIEEACCSQIMICISGRRKAAVNLYPELVILDNDEESADTCELSSDSQEETGDLYLDNTTRSVSTNIRGSQITIRSMEFYNSNFPSADLAEFLKNSESNSWLIIDESAPLSGQNHHTCSNSQNESNNLNSGNTTRLVPHNTRSLRTPPNAASSVPINRRRSSESAQFSGTQRCNQEFPLPHDQFVVRIDGSRRLTRRNRRFLRMYNPVSTSIEEKAFHGWRGNLPSSQESNVRHQRPDFPVKVTADSNGANTGEISEIEADHETVEEDSNKIFGAICLKLVKRFQCGKLGSGVVQVFKVF